MTRTGGDCESRGGDIEAVGRGPVEGVGTLQFMNQGLGDAAVALMALNAGMEGGLETLNAAVEEDPTAPAVGTGSGTGPPRGGKGSNTAAVASERRRSVHFGAGEREEPLGESSAKTLAALIRNPPPPSPCISFSFPISLSLSRARALSLSCTWMSLSLPFTLGSM